MTPYEIVIRFPDKAIADQFCGQMSDGFGEGFCDFSFHRQKPDTDGTQASDFERIFDVHGRPVFFVSSVFDA